jgi:hypothetical protein
MKHLTETEHILIKIMASKNDLDDQNLFSGLIEGHSKTLIIFALSQFCARVNVCIEQLSCCKIKSL